MGISLTKPSLADRVIRAPDGKAANEFSKHPDCARYRRRPRRVAKPKIIITVVPAGEGTTI
jgi:hypothetical protein